MPSSSAPPPPPTRPHLAPVSTMLTVDERLRVDAAGAGVYQTVHRESLDDIVRDLRERRSAAFVVSVARCDLRDTARMASVVREFPRVPAVALLTHVAPSTPQAVLSLGVSGVRTLVDVRKPEGWAQLRDVIVASQASDIQRTALAQLTLDLVGIPADGWRFFEALFTCGPRVSTVRQLSRILGVTPSTLMSRFFRNRLPAPKKYLAYSRLIRAARLLENPGLSVAAVANHLDYSSPQSFGRHIRMWLQMTGATFRRTYDGVGMLNRFREELVLPNAKTWLAFRPLGSTREKDAS
jgi:AraC-like DNA-binding protein